MPTPVGATGQAIVSDGSNSLWDFVTTVGKTSVRTTFQGGRIWNRVTTDASGGGYTVLTGDNLIELTGYGANGSFLLPGAAPAGTIVRITDKDYNCTAYQFRVTAASGTISGQASWDLLVDGMSADFVSDGTNWTVEPTGGADVIQDIALLPSTSSGLLVRFRADTGIVIATGVSSWTPKNSATGFGNAATQGVGGQQPTRTSNWSRGQPTNTYVAASSQFLRTTSWTGSAVTQPFTVYDVWDTADTTATARIIHDNNTNGVQANYLDYGSSSGILRYSNGSAVSTTPAVEWVDRKMITCFVYHSNTTNPNKSVAYLFGQSILAASSTSQGTNVPSGVTFGGSTATSPTNFHNGTHAEHALFSGAHSDRQRNDVLRLLGRWYAVG